MDLISFLAWILFGALAGWLASIIMGKNRKMGALANIDLVERASDGTGAFLGGAIMNFFGMQGVTGFNLPSLLVAILGAVVLLFIVGLIRK